MHTEFRALKLYTWVNNNDWCHTATIYKDDQPHSRIAKADANKFCEKWNGRSGNFEVKRASN